MASCVWCGFDRLDANAETCDVCGQSPDSGAITLDSPAAPTAVTEERSLEAPRLTRVFADHYAIQGAIGHGGMGSVFRVVDDRDGHVWALKVLNGAADTGSSLLKRFEREARLLARIQHPGIPRIHDFGVVAGSMYLVVEHIDGVNLRDAVAAGGALPIEEVVRIGAAVAECLNAAHEHGVVHRDVKPHNVMLTRDGRVLLIDFGVARDAALNATAITDANALLGTPHYMSPEQFDGSRVDARTDVYSLGVLLFEIATGRLPFRAETPTAIALKHVSELPPHPRSLRAEVPMQLDRVILKCLEKSPSDRYPTASDVARELKRTLESKRSVERTRIGDFVVREESAEEWAMVLASPRDKGWAPGLTVSLGGSYFKLVRIDVDPTYPAPFVYRFTFWPEVEAVRRFVDYDLEPAPPAKPGLSRLFKR